MKSFAALLVLASLSVPALAAAETAPLEAKVPPAFSDSRFDRAYVGLEASAGIQAPLGMFGVAAIYNPVPFIGVELGVGAGKSGLQKAAMVRASLMGSTGISLGAGVSSGPFTCCQDLFSSDEKHWSTAHWGNLEVSLHGSSEHYLVRVFLGHSSQFWSSKYCAESSRPGCDTDDGTSIVYAGVALRGAMPL